MANRGHPKKKRRPHAGARRSRSKQFRGDGRGRGGRVEPRRAHGGVDKSPRRGGGPNEVRLQAWLDASNFKFVFGRKKIFRRVLIVLGVYTGFAMSVLSVLVFTDTDPSVLRIAVPVMLVQLNVMIGAVILTSIGGRK